MSFLMERCLLAALLLSALTAVGQTQPDAAAVNAAARVARQADPTQPAASQRDSGWLQPGEDPENRLVLPFVKHLGKDQKEFWTAPAKFQVKDLKWIVPSAGFLSAFIASDSWWAKQVSTSHISTSKTISDYGLYSLIGLGGASFAVGHLMRNDHLEETGLLSGEAAINSTGVAYLLKEITQRQRPLEGNGNGDFFKGGTSTPSEHSAIAWSIASVWAHEYPGTLSQIAAYGLASTITLTRVTAKQHFPSDVIVGSALGWYFGRQVYRAHHDPEVGGSGWGSLAGERAGERTRNPAYMASPYVPLDSWIYPALERLIGLGYLQSPILGMRPWTRMQCARVLDDAADKLADNQILEGQAGSLYRALDQEFSPEVARLNGESNVAARVESFYTRSTGISGTPLRDAFHFGQTVTNDYGRPYWTGFNNVTGVTADAELGPVAFSLQGEYQHAPAMPTSSPQVLAATAAADANPPLANGTSEANQFRLLSSMASVNINNVQISFGNQSVWLGPGESGSLLMSDNAAPFPMVRIDDVMPHEIPGLSRLLGPFRTEFFIGQLSGQRWERCVVSTCQSYPGYPGIVGPTISPQPFIHGEKISFQPTPNFEFGMGITAMFGGPGLPVTFGTFFDSYYVHTTNLAKNPGKRVSSADFSYRIPGLRNWLTLYMDAMAWDEVSPVGSTRANVNPGIYMPQIPKIPKMEFRAEGINESRNRVLRGTIYYNGDRYRSGYSNDGTLMGSWIGREGRGAQGWLTYSFTPRNKLQVGYRLQTVAPAFIGGGRLADYSVRSEFMVGRSISISGLLQQEQWKFPVLASTGQTNFTASLQLTVYPNWRLKK
jgi:membrane-associated phospholipid phosphatase